MAFNFCLIFATMLAVGDIWAVYGITFSGTVIIVTKTCDTCRPPTDLPRPTGIVSHNPSEYHEAASIVRLTSYDDWAENQPHATTWHEIGLAVDSSSPTAPVRVEDPTSTPQTTNPVAPPAPKSDSARPAGTTTLSATGAVGIGIGLAGLVLLVALGIVGIPYFRQWRRAKSLQRALDEIERGVELPKGSVREQDSSKSGDNLVLESQVEIIVEEELSERHVDVVGAWDGWDARGSMEDHRGRKGMSLPRREG